MRGRFERELTLAAAVIVAVGVGEPIAAAGGGPRPILHEPVPPNPAEDLAMRAAIDGNLPAAVQTPHGIIAAPDPQAPPAPGDRDYTGRAEPDQFRPDRDTRRPEVARYDDPFTPSTAPFKRLDAFDAVRPDYTLVVRDPRQTAVAIGGVAGPDDALFFEDVVVDVAPGQSIRIPSVGPGARILRARLGVGAEDEPLRVLGDGADNWQLVATTPSSPHKARLVAELAIARSAFGGPFPDPAWSDLPRVLRLPENVERDAAVVLSAIGVSRRMRPREAVAALVRYFRGFSESADSPRAHGSIYLDLALSKRGVCRHRAFAFLVTAQALGLSARMVLNEAHAWVELHDGSQWRRIDLGGAGQMPESALDASSRSKPMHEPPADPFAWPDDAASGDAMVAHARGQGGSELGPRGRSADLAVSLGVPNGSASPATAATSEASSGSPVPADDDRSPASIKLLIGDADAHRGGPMPIRGSVHAAGEPCARLAVEIFLRDASTKRRLYLGTLATDDAGAFGGAMVVPTSFSLGDYDVIARTAGDARCGAGASE